MHEKEINKKINLPYFYLRRVLRIWPLYYFAVFFGFVLFPLLKTAMGQTPSETASPVLYLTFLGNFNDIINGAPDASVLGVLWSVCIEEQFYLFAPILLQFTPRRALPLLFSLVIGASLLFRHINAHDYNMLYYHTLSAISDISVGGLCAYFCYYQKRFTQSIAQLPRSIIIIIYCLGTLLIIGRMQLFTGTFLITFERLILSFFFAFVILEQTYAANSFYKTANLPRITRWGQISYGLYCLHLIGILCAINLSKLLHANESLFGVIVIETLLAFVFSLLFAELSYRFLETPFLKLKNKFAFAVKK